MNTASVKFCLTGFITAIFIAVIFPATLPAQTKAPVEHMVNIIGFKFVPDNLTVKVGDTITWVNSDIAPHTASAKDRSWDTGTLKYREQKSVLVSKEFIVAYYCRFHPAMKARLSISIAE